MEITLDSEKAKRVLAYWDNSGEDPEMFANRVWADLISRAKPDWELCTDHAARLMSRGRAEWVDGKLRRSMWPHEELKLECRHTIHRWGGVAVEGRIEDGRIEKSSRWQAVGDPIPVGTTLNPGTYLMTGDGHLYATVSESSSDVSW